MSLVDQVEVGRHENTHSCTGNVAVGIGSDTVSVHIEYEVTAGADGEAFYQWDNFSFGQKLLGTAVMSALLDMAHTKTASQNEQGISQQPNAQDDTPAVPDTPPAPIPWSESATASLDIIGVWKRNVHAEIVHRAQALTDMPSGTQRMRFRIGPDGEITAAEALPPIADQQLADKLIAFLNASDQVAKPPFGRVKCVEVTFRFLLRATEQLPPAAWRTIAWRERINLNLTFRFAAVCLRPASGITIEPKRVRRNGSWSNGRQRPQSQQNIGCRPCRPTP